MAPPIVFVDDAHTFGGAQIALAWAIRAVLHQCPTQPMVCVSTPATREVILQIAGEHKNLGFIDCQPALPLNLFAFPLRLWSFYKLLPPLARQGVHTWWLNLAGIEFCMAPLLILRSLGLRPVAWLHNGESGLFFNSTSSPFRRLLSQIRDRVADRVLFGLYGWIITPSQSTETALRSRFHCKCPPQTDFLYPTTGIIGEPQQRVLESTSRSVINLWMIGRVQYVHKNNLVVLQVLAHLLRQHQKAVRLTVVGDGPDMLSFRKTTKDLGLADFVHFVGWNKNPWKSISADAIVIIPSFYEGMPLVATEAMLHAVRIVASPIPAFTEGIPNELIARDFSIGAFAEKVEEVSAMSHDRLLALYAMSLRKFTEEAFVKKFLSILKTSSKEMAQSSEERTSEEED